MAKQKTSWIWADTVRQRPCESARCRKPVWFAQNVKTGGYMPFSSPPTPLLRRNELETNREQWLIDLATSHFADCAARDTFRRGR